MLLVLYKRDTEKALRYYTLDDREQSLFEPFCLTVRWGKSPEGGGKKHYSFKSLAEKNLFIRKLMLKKLKTHKILYSYFKEKQEELRFSANLETGKKSESSGF